MLASGQITGDLKYKRGVDKVSGGRKCPAYYRTMYVTDDHAVTLSTSNPVHCPLQFHFFLRGQNWCASPAARHFVFVMSAYSFHSTPYLQSSSTINWCVRWTMCLHRKLTLGEKSLAAPGNRTCVGSLPVRCSINRATSPPLEPGREKWWETECYLCLCVISRYQTHEEGVLSAVLQLRWCRARTYL